MKNLTKSAFPWRWASSSLFYEFSNGLRCEESVACFVDVRRVIPLSFAALGNSEVREDRKNMGARMVVEGANSFCFLSNIDVEAIPALLGKTRVRVRHHCFGLFVCHPDVTRVIIM